jgi:anti-sigma factor RsiW
VSGQLGEHVGDRISAWLDDELDEAAGRAVEAHVGACPACALERDEVVSARDVLRGLPLLDPPAGALQPRPALHLGDALSALLDGELERAEAARAAEHADACAVCGAELAEVTAARSALRSLPLLDAPPGVLRPARVRSHARRSRTRRAALTGAAAAAMGVAALLGSAQPVVAEQPAMAALVAEHAGASRPAPRVTPLSLGTLGTLGPSTSVAAPAAPDAPEWLAPDYHLQSIRRTGGRVQATYGDAEHTLSLFSRLRGGGVGRAPGPGVPVAVGAGSGRRWVSTDGVVVVWSTGDAAYAIVTDAPPVDAVAAASSVPSGRNAGLVERVRARCHSLTDLIG